MKIQNKTSNGFSHVMKEQDEKGYLKDVLYTVAAGGVADVPDEVAQVWLKIPGVVQYVAPEDLKKVEEEAKAKQAALEKENEALKAKLAELEAKEEKAEKETKPKAKK